MILSHDTHDTMIFILDNRVVVVSYDSTDDEIRQQVQSSFTTVYDEYIVVN